MASYTLTVDGIPASKAKHGLDGQKPNSFWQVKFVWQVTLWNDEDPKQSFEFTDQAGRVVVCTLVSAA